MEWNDAATVAQIRGGDREAFRVLVEKHSRNVFKVAYRMTGNEQDAEEVVQETFLRCYRWLDKFEARSNLGTWLHRIAANCSYDLLEKRQQHEKGRLLQTEEEDGSDPVARLPSGSPSPERMVLSSEMQQKVDEALGTLTPVEKTAFVLRHFEEQSIEQIGAVLKLTDGAAKNSIFRAVKKMRRALEPALRGSR